MRWQAPRQTPIPQPEADLPAFAYGPGGSTPGAFPAWAGAHQNWLGTEHLLALMKLSGQPPLLQLAPVLASWRETQKTVA